MLPPAIDLYSKRNILDRKENKQKFNRTDKAPNKGLIIEESSFY